MISIYFFFFLPFIWCCTYGGFPCPCKLSWSSCSVDLAMPYFRLFTRRRGSQSFTVPPLKFYQRLTLTFYHWKNPVNSHAGQMERFLNPWDLLGPSIERYHRAPHGFYHSTFRIKQRFSKRRTSNSNTSNQLVVRARAWWPIVSSFWTIVLLVPCLFI